MSAHFCGTRCDFCVANLGAIQIVNHLRCGLPMCCFFGGIRLARNCAGWDGTIQCFAGFVHPVDPVSVAYAHSCYSIRLTVAQCVFAKVLFNPARDCICLGISMGCTVASTSAFMLEVLGHGVRALVLLDDRSRIPTPHAGQTVDTASNYYRLHCVGLSNLSL